MTLTILASKQNLDQIVERPVLQVDVLGAGVDRTVGPEMIRSDDFEAMCEDFRSRYDIVIVDTGPLVGSIEILPVAAAADGVILSIRRGRGRSRLDDCIKELGVSGTPHIGVVLNCAVQADCERYVSKSTNGSELREAAEGDSDNGPPEGAPVVVTNPLVCAMEVASVN